MNQRTVSPVTDWGILTQFDDKRTTYLVHVTCQEFFPAEKNARRQLSKLVLSHWCDK